MPHIAPVPGFRPGWGESTSPRLGAVRRQAPKGAQGGLTHDKLRGVEPITGDRPDVQPKTLDTVKSWTPAVAATLLGLPLVAMSALKFLVLVVVLSSPDLLDSPEPGVTNLRPPTWVIVLGIAETSFLLLAPVVLIGLSWLYANRGRARASWVCAVAVGLLACIYLVM